MARTPGQKNDNVNKGIASKESVEGCDKFYKFTKSIFDGNDVYAGGFVYCLPDELASKYAADIVPTTLAETSPDLVRCNCKH